MKVILDGDTVAFACAASGEEAEPWVSTSRAQTMIENIMVAVDCNDIEVWLSGKRNFRYGVYPEYKANRIGAYRPKWEKAVKDYLTNKWQANWTDGIEADDMAGIRLIQLGDNGILAHIDKDINQITGWHYNWPLSRKGEVIRPGKRYYVTPEEGDRWFWMQLLMGDTTDNIPGVNGIGPKKAEKAYSLCESNQECYEVAQGFFSCEEELDMNAQCVYIWRKEGDNWRNLLNDNRRWDSQKGGPKDEDKDSSLEYLEQVTNDGP
jgi:hypothetical protein